MAVKYNLNSVGVDADRDLQAWTLRDRKYRLKVITGENTYEVGDVDGAGDFPLHINFRVEKVYGTAMNLASIKLWNISTTLQTMLLAEGTKIELRAGYGDAASIPVIFQGTVVQMYAELSGADRVYNIEAVDGFEELGNSFISISFVPNTSLYDVFRGIAREIGIRMIMTPTAERMARSMKCSDGASIYGRGADILSYPKIKNDFNWRIEAGVLHISYKKEAADVSKFAYVLTPNTGLIGMPLKLFESSVTQNEGLDDLMRYSIYGYRVQFFLNGALQIDDAVYLESREVSGPFTIHKMTMTGDNLSGDWICTAELKEYSP